MENKELNWKRMRLGRITASELGDIVSASGKIIDGNIDYVRKKRFERSHGFSYPISGRALELGHEQEPYAVKWWNANCPNLPIVYAQDLEEIPFWAVNWAKFGASPDAYAPDQSYVVEIKSVVGNTTAEFFADDRTDYAEKRAVVLKEHGPQLAGQFLSNPKVEKIYLLKYIFQRDEVDDDTDSPLEPWRGIVFEFTRADFDLDDLQNRIILFDLFIDSEYNAKDFKGTKVSSFSIEISRDTKGNIVSTKLLPPEA